MYKIILLMMFVLVSCSKTKPGQSEQASNQEPDFFQSSILVSSGDSEGKQLLFGQVDRNKIYKARISVLNKGSVKQAVNISPSDFDIAPYTMQSFCQNVELETRSRCNVDISLDTSSLPPGLVDLKTITIVGVNIQISAQVKVPPVELLKVSPEIGLNFGQVFLNKEKRMNVKVTNPLPFTKSLDLDVSSLSSFSVAMNDCPLMLGARKSCTLSVLVDSSSVGLKESSFLVGGNTIYLQAEIVDLGQTVQTSWVPRLNSINMGSLFLGTQDVEIVFDNNSSSNFSGVSVVGVSSPFSLKENGCAEMKSRKSCKVVLTASASALLNETPYINTIQLSNTNFISSQVSISVVAGVVYTYDVAVFNTGELDNVPLYVYRREYHDVVSPATNGSRSQAALYPYFVSIKNKSTKKIAEQVPVPAPITFSIAQSSPAIYISDTAAQYSASIKLCGFPSFTNTLSGQANDQECATVLRILDTSSISSAYDDNKSYMLRVSYGSPIQFKDTTFSVGRFVKTPSEKYAVALMESSDVGTFVPTDDTKGALAKIDLGTKNFTIIGTCDLDTNGAPTNLFASSGNRTNPAKAFGVYPYIDGSAKRTFFKSSAGNYYFAGKGCVNNSGSRVMDSSYSMWQYDPSQNYQIGTNPKKIFSGTQDATSPNFVEMNNRLFFHVRGTSASSFAGAIIEHNLSTGLNKQVQTYDSVVTHVGGNNLVRLNNKLYFVSSANGQNGYFGNVLFEYDPSSAMSFGVNPKPVSLSSGSFGTNAYSGQDDSGMIAVGNKIVFGASLEKDNKFQLFVYDTQSLSLSAIESVSSDSNSRIRFPRHFQFVGNNKVIMSAFVQTVADANPIFPNPSIDGEDRICVLDVSSYNAKCINTNPYGRDLYHNTKKSMQSGNFYSASVNSPDFNRPYNTKIAVLNNKAYFRGNTGWFADPSMSSSPGSLNPNREFGEISLFSYDSLTDTFIEESQFFSHATGFTANTASCTSAITCSLFQTSAVDDSPMSMLKANNGKLYFSHRTMPPIGTSVAIFDPSAPKTDQAPELGGKSIFMQNSNPMAKMKIPVFIAPYSLDDGRVLFPRNTTSTAFFAAPRNNFFDIMLGTDNMDTEILIQVNLELPQTTTLRMVELVDVQNK